MAHCSYLVRRDGRYYLQARLAPFVARVVGQPLLRRALRTGDYRVARVRVGECMGWVHRMNESVDYVSLFEKNVRQLRLYLEDKWPPDRDRLFARENYEELLKNFNRRAQAAGFEPAVFDPGYLELFRTFVGQNVQAAAYWREMRETREYERGRADMARAVQFGVATTSAAAPQPWPEASSWQAPQPWPMPVEIAALAEPSSPPEAPPEAAAPVIAPTDRTDAPPEHRGPRLSAALEAFLEMRRELRGHDGERDETGLVIRFFIDVLGDPLVADISRDDLARIERMLPDIPDRRNIPTAEAESLFRRYSYAREHGWDGLKRLTEARLRNGYHSAVTKFFRWLIQEGHYRGAEPKFTFLSRENLVSLPRDAFNDGEVLKIFGMPLFTGCLGHARVWQPGGYFLQSHLYWAYILLLLTGMRPGEVGQLETSDLIEEDGIVFIRLRAFDPAQGRVARKDLRQLKTAESARLIPLHPLIVELGLLDRVEDLKVRDCPYLFPEWAPYRKPNGEWRWGQPVTKSWQYLKVKLGLTRSDVSLYSTRHWMAERLDELVIAQRTRNRIMGHSTKNDVPGRYGSKGRMSSADVRSVVSATSPLIEEISKILLKARAQADAGELQVLKPWLQEARWSDYYREKMR